jgi:hypothetical protein
MMMMMMVKGLSYCNLWHGVASVCLLLKDVGVYFCVVEMRPVGVLVDQWSILA